MKKILTWMIIASSILLICGILLNYHIDKQEQKEVMCHKGKLIHRIGDDGSVYLKVRGVSCVFEKGMIIIEEQS